MKQLKFIEKRFGVILAALAFFTAGLNSTMTCSFIFHQPKMPEGLKQRRR